MKVSAIQCLSLSLSPVVGRGEGRGPADLLPDGHGVEEDPRLRRLLHLRHHRQHRYPLHPAEGAVRLGGGGIVYFIYCFVDLLKTLHAGRRPGRLQGVLEPLIMGA